MRFLKIFGKILLFGGGLVVILLVFSTIYHRYQLKSEAKKYLPLLKSKELSKEDKEKLIAIFYKRSITKNMLNEIDYLQENVKKVKANGIPNDIPMYFFVSDASDVIMPNWREELSKYNSKINFGKIKSLDTGHYIHHEKSAIIADESKAFLKEIDSD